MMQMVGSFAEFERAMIRERTSAGLAEARADGRIGGRRAKLTPDQRTDVIDNVLSGRKSAAEMARLYKVSESTISRVVGGAVVRDRDGPRDTDLVGKGQATVDRLAAVEA